MQVSDRIAFVTFLAFQVIAASVFAAPDDTPPKTSEGALREKTVYVPYEKITEVFEKEGRGIFMPYHEFLELWARAQPKPQPDEIPAPPAEAVISGGRYIGKVSGDLVRFDVRYQVEALKPKGWSVLRFEMPGAAIESAVVRPADDAAKAGDDASPPLFVGGDGHYGAFFPRAGSYELELRMAVRVQTQPGQRRIQFGIPAVATSVLDLSLPEENPDLEVQPASTATEVTVDGGKTRVVAYLGNSKNVGVTWSPRVREVQKEEALYTATQNIHTFLGERVLRLNTAVQLQVLSQEVNRILVSIPENMQVVSVEGEGENIRQSTIQKDENVLEIKLHSGVRDRYAFEVGFERILDDRPSSLSVSFPSVSGVLRESGYVALAFDESLRVRVTSQNGLNQQDLAELPDALKSGAQFGFRYLAQPIGLDLSIEKILPVVHGDSKSVVLFGVEEDVWIGWVDYRISRAGIFTTQVEIPARWQIEKISVESTMSNSVEDFQTLPREGTDFKIVQVNLKNRAIDDLRLHFHLSAEGSARAGVHRVHAPRLIGIQRDRGIVGVGAPRSLGLTTNSVEKAIPTDVQELFRVGILGRLPQDANASLAYKFNEQPASVDVELADKTTEISVASRRLVNVTENAVQITHDLEYHIQFAAVDRLAFSAPSAYDERIQISTRNFKEQSVQPAGDGRSLWQVGLQRPELGIVTIRLSLVEDLKGLRVGDSRSVELPLIRAETLPGAEVRGEEGTIAIRKEGSLEISATTENLEKIDARELPPELAQGQIYEAYRFSESDHRMTLGLTRHEYIALADALVSFMQIKSHLSSERMLTSAAAILVQNYGRQYLNVRLPVGAVVHSVSVGGKSDVRSHVVPDRPGEHRIPLSGPGHASGDVLVMIVYRVDLGDDMGKLGALDIVAPVVEESVPVGKIQLELYLPEDFVYVGWSGTLHRIGREGGLWLPWSALQQGIGVDSDPPDRRRGRGSPIKPEVFNNLPVFEEGLRFDLHGFARDGQASMWFVRSKTYDVLCWLLFLGVLGVGALVVRKRSADRWWWIGGTAIIALLLAWLYRDDLNRIFVSVFFATATVVAASLALSAWRRSRASFAGWRARRVSLAPDPFLEEATVVAPVIEETASPEPVTSEEPAKASEEDVETATPGKRAKKKKKKKTTKKRKSSEDSESK